MEDKRETIKGILAAYIGRFNKGAMIPTPMLVSFLDIFLQHSIHDNHLAVEPLLQWLKSECDFNDREVTALMDVASKQILDKTGVMVAKPEEAHFPVEKKPESAASAGGEWDGRTDRVEDETDDRLTLADYDDPIPGQDAKKKTLNDGFIDTVSDAELSSKVNINR